ncbi:MAG: recombinase family protein [Clostridiales bacterium]|nr:recombinase family protein [Clostridiales bacterium]
MKAAAYARYSTDRQTENSIAYQLAEIRRYCAAHSIDIVATYTDEGQSGTNTDRAGFQAMVAAARAGAFEAVVIYDISRGSRDVGDWFSFRKSMMYLGIAVISATGQRLGDLTNGQDFLLELLTVGMGQAEVLGTRQKSLDGVAAKAKTGAFLGGTPPLGYDIRNGEYIINQQEAAIVRQIFEMYAAGKSYDYMLGKLVGATGKRGRPLGKNSFRAILTNERYIGVYTWNKRQYKLLRKWAGGKPNPDVVRIEDVIPPIIDEGLWERVQERMKDNKRNATNKAKHNYLLSGLIECEECGANFVGHTTTNSRGYSTRYYVCGNKYRTHTCHAKNINADEIETFVVQNLKAYLLEIDFSETAQQIAGQINAASADLSAEKAELAQVTAQINNGIKAIMSGMDFPELREEVDRQRVRKSELEDIIRRRSADRPEVDPAAIEQLLRDSVEQWDEEHLPEIIRQHVTKIYAHTDGTYTVNVGVHLSGCGGRI